MRRIAPRARLRSTWAPRPRGPALMLLSTRGRCAPACRRALLSLRFRWLRRLRRRRSCRLRRATRPLACRPDPQQQRCRRGPLFRFRPSLRRRPWCVPPVASELPRPLPPPGARLTRAARSRCRSQPRPRRRPSPGRPRPSARRRRCQRCLRSALRRLCSSLRRLWWPFLRPRPRPVARPRGAHTRRSVSSRPQRRALRRRRWLCRSSDSRSSRCSCRGRRGRSRRSRHRRRSLCLRRLRRRSHPSLSLHRLRRSLLRHSSLLRSLLPLQQAARRGVRRRWRGSLPREAWSGARRLRCPRCRRYRRARPQPRRPTRARRSSIPSLRRAPPLRSLCQRR
jgi:hypothetical protein